MANMSTQRVVTLGALTSDSVSPIFVDLDICHAHNVRGRFELSELQGLSLVHSVTHGGKFEVMHLDRHISASNSDAIYACVPLSGNVSLTQQDRTCELARGDIGLMDARTEYRMEMSDNLDAIWIRISPETLESRSSNFPSMTARRLDGSQGLGLIASRFILSTASQVEILAQHRSSPVATILLDLLCATADAADEPLTMMFQRSGARTLERAKEFIELHLGEEDLDPAQIAAGTGISKRYLSELFASEGTATMRWVKARRLELARLALEGRIWTPGCIAEVAYRHGFTDVTSFNRSFRRAFDRSPRQFMLLDGELEH